jgi:hypothetical protein
MPLLREIKRFVRKCPQLEAIGTSASVVVLYHNLTALRMVWQKRSRIVGYNTPYNDFQDQHQCFRRIHGPKNHGGSVESNHKRKIN